MSPDEGQEEYEEAQAEVKKREDEVGKETAGRALTFSALLSMKCLLPCCTI